MRGGCARIRVRYHCNDEKPLSFAWFVSQRSFGACHLMPILSQMNRGLRKGTTASQKVSGNDTLGLGCTRTKQLLRSTEDRLSSDARTIRLCDFISFGVKFSYVLPEVGELDRTVHFESDKRSLRWRWRWLRAQTSALRKDLEAEL